MEGVSGEGVRRRREYSEESEETKIAEMTAAELVRARERALDASESGEQVEVSTRELVEQVVKELGEEEKNEGEISRKLEDALEELEEMEKASESTEEKLRRALEEVEEKEKKVIDEASEEQSETKEPHFGEIRTKEDFDRAVENHSELKLREEQEEQMENSASRIQELDESWVRDVISELESKEWNQEDFDELLSEVSQNLPESSRAFYIDVTKSLEVTSKELDSFEQGFHQARESHDGTEEVRFGLVGERLYVWKPDLDSTGLENVYDDLYYYFRCKTTFDRYVEDVADSLGLQDKSQGKIQSYLKELSPQLVTYDAEAYCFNPKLRRIRGDYVSLMNDLSGKTLSDLEEDISKITGYNGHGGIENPKFPQGEKLEVAVARIAAAVFSDGTIEPNGVIKYAEPQMNRIEKVVENVRVFGDITPSSTRREGEGHYITHLSFVLGKMLMSREVPSGDRTIQNPRLSSCIREGTDTVKRAYIEDFAPQDACVGQKSVIWRRVNALHAGEKTEKWKFEPRVGVEEIELIKEHGRESTGNAQSWTLSWGGMTELSDHSDRRIAKTAETLKQVVQDNPNRLMHDEATILREMGIDVGTRPSDVVYYPKSGRVSVVWQAYTVGVKETIKFGIVTCPNDVNNREKMKEIITSHPKETEEALGALRERGIEFTKWWKGN